MDYCQNARSRPASSRARAPVIARRSRSNPRFRRRSVDEFAAPCPSAQRVAETRDYATVVANASTEFSVESWIAALAMTRRAGDFAARQFASARRIVGADPAIVGGLRQDRRFQDGNRSLPPFRAGPLPPTTRLKPTSSRARVSRAISEAPRSLSPCPASAATCPGSSRAPSRFRVCREVSCPCPGRWRSWRAPCRRNRSATARSSSPRALRLWRV